MVSENKYIKPYKLLVQISKFLLQKYNYLYCPFTFYNKQSQAVNTEIHEIFGPLHSDLPYLKACNGYSHTTRVEFIYDRH